MTTDRELLELAAKAAGIEITWSDATECYWISDETWCPLDEDGDALRLAVKLDIVPRCINGIAFAWKDCICDVTEAYTDDLYASTRRAIVRAAAEIGRGMK